MSRTRQTAFLSAARVVGIAVQVVSVPIVLDAIGLVKYGACMFLLALSRWVGLLDVGFLDGSQRRMTLAFDAGDESKGFTTVVPERVRNRADGLDDEPRDVAHAVEEPARRTGDVRGARERPRSHGGDQYLG